MSWLAVNCAIIFFATSKFIDLRGVCYWCFDYADLFTDVQCDKYYKGNSGSRREFYVVSRIKEVMSALRIECNDALHEVKGEMCYGGLRKETAEQFIRKLGGAIRTDYHLILLFLRNPLNHCDYSLFPTGEKSYCPLSTDTFALSTG